MKDKSRRMALRWLQSQNCKNEQLKANNMKQTNTLLLVLSAIFISASLICSDMDKKKSAAQQQTKFKPFCDDEEVDLSTITEIEKIGGPDKDETHYFANIPGSRFSLECTKYQRYKPTHVSCGIRKPAPKEGTWVPSMERPGELEKVYIGTLYRLPSSVFATAEAMHKAQEQRKAPQKRATEKEKGQCNVM